MNSAVFSFNTLILIGILVTAAIAVFSRKLLTCIIALGVTGCFVALEFLVLQAPDVAIAEAAVGAVLTTVIFIIALKKTTKKEDEKNE
ncbi:MAG: DUF4040 domain-containing protein [Parasporobacterium sp.]|nr:DUF4040 domain-containing protein [Parasporobacterium sp.]